MNTLSDPLFVRAEVEYRLERYGVTAPRPRVDAWPARSRRRWPRWARRSTAAGPARAGIAVTCPQHP